MSNLRVGPIKDFALGIYDSHHATPKDSDEGPVFLGIKNVTPQGILTFSEIKHISEQEYPEWIKRVVPRENDIVFSYEATLHRYALVPRGFRGCLGRHMALLRPDTAKVHPRFLHYYFLTSSWRAVVEANIISGAGVDRISLKSFSYLEVRLPALPVQQRIASILSAYDDLIENNRRRIQLLEQTAQVLYKEWFVHLRFPGHEHVKIKDGVPEGWTRQTLSSLAESVSYGLKASFSLEEAGPKYLRITDIVQSVIKWEDVAYCEATTKEVDRNRLEVGDVVVVRNGATVGYAKLISYLDYQAVYASFLVRFRFRTPAMSFIAGIFMESDAYKKYVRNLAGGTVHSKANAKLLGAAVFLMPPQVLQDQFCDSIRMIYRQRDTLIRQNVRLSTARDLLFPRLMNGEITV
ncbi:MAG: restriction endonuclease subunit S [Desulfobulbaceae bacterium]|nr:restriction endonuclease subunit S [Desulfobulbaceae bacterium]